ncbi:hypothetical protein FOV01_02905 [Enterococcus faecalis]|nr:hypothetical protein FOV01_02905 [Enterococcus faecalis]
MTFNHFFAKKSDFFHYLREIPQKELFFFCYF